MELPGLEKSKCKALRRIASHTYSSTAERERGKAPGAGFPRPKGKAVGDGGAGTTPSETAAAAKRPITRYVNRALRPGARTPSDGLSATSASEAPKPGSHNVGLDEERRGVSSRARLDAGVPITRAAPV